MTEQKKENRQALLRLADEMVEDILAASNEEVLAEFAEAFGDPAAFAEKMRSVSTEITVGINKGRLIAARRAMEAERRTRTPSVGGVAVELARRALGKILASNANSLPVTIAARKEKINDMSDSDVLGMVEDLKELGFVLRIKSDEKKDG